MGEGWGRPSRRVHAATKWIFEVGREKNMFSKKFRTLSHIKKKFNNSNFLQFKFPFVEPEKLASSLLKCDWCHLFLPPPPKKLNYGCASGVTPIIRNKILMDLYEMNVKIPKGLHWLWMGSEVQPARDATREMHCRCTTVCLQAWVTTKAIRAKWGERTPYQESRRARDRYWNWNSHLVSTSQIFEHK